MKKVTVWLDSNPPYCFLSRLSTIFPQATTCCTVWVACICNDFCIPTHLLSPPHCFLISRPLGGKNRTDILATHPHSTLTPPTRHHHPPVNLLFLTHSPPAGMPVWYAFDKIQEMEENRMQDKTTCWTVMICASHIRLLVNHLPLILIQ